MKIFLVGSELHFEGQRHKYRATYFDPFGSGWLTNLNAR